jgi:imidazolonepropionase-like amidohydrolase
MFTARVTNDLSRRGFLAGMTASIASLGLPDFAQAQSAAVPGAVKQAIVLRNLRLFDGAGSTLREGAQVFVVGARIADIATADVKPPDGAKIIDCGGRTLMPGLIDAHVHSMMAALPLAALMTADVGFIHLAASAEAQKTLMRGFTSVRDLSGPVFALKKAIDMGMIVGPRIYPCGAMISQTSGHGDFRMTSELPRNNAPSRAEVLGASAIADSPDEVRRATREQLMMGATHIKIAAGGGVSSSYDPLDVNQFRPEEIRAAVEAAEDWGTYVAAHVYTPVGIQRCIKAGVKSIEHGQLTDEDSVRMMADNGTWWCLQPFIEDKDQPSAFAEGTPNRAKQLTMFEGTPHAYELAQKYRIRTAFGTDILFDPRSAARQGANLARLAAWRSPAEALVMATSQNGELLALSGPRNPYDGKLGIIEKGAFADMLLVDGDPLADLNLVADPDKNFRIIMKDGRIYKNTL